MLRVWVSNSQGRLGFTAGDRGAGLVKSNQVIMDFDRLTILDSLLLAVAGSAVGCARVLVHVYADEPAQRFVILNSRKLREGDTGPEGLAMEEILPEGVVLGFKGHRFFIPR